MRLLAFIFLLLGAPFMFAAPPSGSYYLTLDEEFNAPIDTTNLWNLGAWVDNPGTELQIYTSTNVVVTNGVLQLWSRHDGGVYTSGKISTLNKWSQKYGYWEAKIMMSNGVANLWPTWWSLMSPYNTNDGLNAIETNWPPEVDIMEVAGTPSGSLNNLGCKVWRGNNYPSSGGGGAVSDDVATGGLANLMSGFHTYGYRWSTTNHTFYVDDVSIGSTAAHPYTVYPMFPILQQAILTGVGTLPAAMQVDYVRIYQFGSTNPVINTQPQNQTVTVGQTATFTVTATASIGTLDYQWTFNGSNVGTDSSSYARSNCQLADNGGSVAVSVTDSNGVANSSTATLTVTGAAVVVKSYGSASLGRGIY